MSNSETKLFAVTGKPIIHSKSPLMFNNAFEQGNIDAAYFRLAAKNAEQAIFMFKEIGISGMNVTAPYKEDMLKLVDEVHEEAKIIGGINTIVEKEGKLHGYNTDHYGVTQSFANANIDVAGKTCVVLGAGGAGKAAAYGMIQKGAKVTIVNRTYEKAALAAKALNCEVAALEKVKSIIKKSDIIISSLSQNVKVIKRKWLKAEHIVFDANYKGSRLIPKAEEKGCTIVNAEDWLLNQALLAYELFLGTPANKEHMAEGLTQEGLAAKKHTISTIGLMGCGKTSHGKVLANKIEYSFKDTDDAIVAKQERPITEIFEKEGEAYFRELETQELSESFNAETPHVLSCGGGIITNQPNRDLLKSNSIVVWLFASPKAIMARTNIEKRPLLQVADPEAKLRELLQARKGMYAKTADIVFSTEIKNRENNTDQMIKEFNVL